jgi:hypothetical protein
MYISSTVPTPLLHSNNYDQVSYSPTSKLKEVIASSERVGRYIAKLGGQDITTLQWFLKNQALSRTAISESNFSIRTILNKYNFLMLLFRSTTIKSLIRTLKCK